MEIMVKKMLIDATHAEETRVVVVEGNSLKETLSNDLNYLDEEIYKLLSKFSLTDVVEIVHKLTGITKNKVYKWVLNLKNS